MGESVSEASRIASANGGKKGGGGRGGDQGGAAGGAPAGGAGSSAGATSGVGHGATGAASSAVIPQARGFADVLIAGGRLASGEMSLRGELQPIGESRWRLRPREDVGRNGSHFLRWIGTELAPVPTKEACGTRITSGGRRISKRRAFRGEGIQSGNEGDERGAVAKSKPPASSGPGLRVSRSGTQWASRVRQ